MAYTVLRHVTVVDGTGASPRPGQTIVVNGNKIESIATDTSAKYPADSAVYDGDGGTACPGFIDAHLHTAYTGGPDLAYVYKDLPSFIAMRATVHARRLLHAGVTSVRDAGSTAYADIALRQAIDAGLVPGPRMRACGYGLKMTGGHGDSFFSPIVEVSQPGMANTPDEARKVARMNLKMGADHIKIISASGGVMSAGTEPGAPQMTVEEMRAAIDEAHKAGKPAMAHTHGTQAVKNAILAGIDSVEHGSYLDDEAIEMLLQRGVFLVPTLLAPVRIVQHGERGGIPEYAVRKAKLVSEEHAKSFARAVRAGVKIAMGTDAGTPYNVHGENLNELPLMVQAGMTPMQAIVASTKMGAELLQWGDKVGTLEAGKLADIVLVDGNPLDRIELLPDPAKIRLILKDGAVVRADARMVPVAGQGVAVP
jgi:imidazolonepropionase-like amidohydrolase